MGLLKLKEKSSEEQEQPIINSDKPTEFISHTTYRRYPDGRIFPVKTWITQLGFAKPVKAKKKVAVTLNAKEEEEVLL
jgi:hypothetical protein